MSNDLESVKESIIIHRTPAEVYGFWRQLENLPMFMQHLQEVKKINGAVYHWKTKAPMGTSVEWDATITEEKTNQLIRWKSVEGSEIENGGTVYFTDAMTEGGKPLSTRVEVEFFYKQPFGKLGSFVAMLFGENPSKQVKDDLQKLKSHLESTESTESQDPQNKKDDDSLLDKVRAKITPTPEAPSIY